LPVNAQESYEEKRALRFFGGIINLVAITGAIFLILFYGFLAFLFYLENQQSQKLANLPNVQTTNNQLDQKEVTEMSTLVKKIAGLISGEESWAPILSQINVASKKGINLTNITWVKSGEPVNLVGNAQSQDALADFKNILSKSSYFDRVTLSSTNLNENQTLNFTISLTLKSKALETNE
jgi:Tfp pilus assembly protein PilN